MRAIISALLIGALLVGTTIAAYGGSDSPSLSGVEMFPLEDLRPGLQATGYTVIRGTEIESFNVEVLELIPDGGFDGGPMILARFTGSVIDFSNGIAGGYSGSPVYVKGKLMGAVSMAMPFTDTHVGGITPIQSMLKALPGGEEVDTTGITVLPDTENSGTPVDEDGNVISFVDDYQTALAFNMEMRELGEHRYAAVLTRTPIVCSGLSPLVREMYGDQIEDMFGERFQMVDAPAGRAGNNDLGFNGMTDKMLDTPGLFLHKVSDEPPLRPGDACAVSLVEGDVEMSAIGTVTYSDNEGRFLLFGHPMFGEGKASFPVGKAYITWVYGSIIRAFKNGVRLNTLGTVTGDHNAACGGSFDIEPDMIPVRFKLKDADGGDSVTKRFRVMRHNDFTPLLISMAMSQAANEVLDRRPGGTLKMSYHIEGVGLKEPLRRTDYYYSDSNVLGNAAFQLVPIADLLANNIYREIKITKVEILAEITENRINVSIDDAEIVDKDNGEAIANGDAEDEEAAELDGAIVAEEDDDATENIDTETNANETAVAASVRRHTGSKAKPLFKLNENWGKLYKSYLKNIQQGPEEMPADETMPVDAYMDYDMADIPSYKPGETIRVKVRLQPYRSDPTWREFSIDVPLDFPAGSTSLTVHGGGDLMSWSELGGKGRDLFGFGPMLDLREHDLDDILEQIIDAPHNNELLLTLYRPYDYSMDMEIDIENGEAGDSDSSVEDEEEPEDHIDAVYQMEWVIYNSWYLPVNIEGDESEIEDIEEVLDDENGDGDEPYEGYDDEDEYETNLPF